MASERVQVRLGDIITTVVDNRGKTPPLDINGNHELIEVNAVVGDAKAIDFSVVKKFVSDDVFKNWFRKGHPKTGDVLFSTVGSIAEIAYVHAERGCIAQNLIALRPNDKLLDGIFLYYLLKDTSVKAELLSLDISSVQPSIKVPHLLDKQIPLPPLPEQRAIAEILGPLDDKIELNRRMNETLEAMARDIFKDWFVDFGPTRAKMEGHEPYLAAELWALFPERIDDEGKPEGWETVNVSSIIEFNPTERLRKGELTPYLNMASLPTIGASPDMPVMREFGSGMKFRNRDTLLARITPCLENGKTAYIQCLENNAVAWGSTEFIVMRSIPPVPAAYSYILARESSFRSHAIQSMTGTSGRQRANTDAIAQYSVTIPNNETIWHEFGNTLDAAFEMIAKNALESVTLAQTRDLLIPRLLSGEIRVKDVDKMVEEIS